MTPLRPVIIDSSALVALTYPGDADHEKAVAFSTVMRETRAVGLISPSIFAETLNLLGKKFGRDVALAAGKRIVDDPGLMCNDPRPGADRSPQRWTAQGGGVSYTDSYVMATRTSSRQRRSSVLTRRSARTAIGCRMRLKGAEDGVNTTKGEDRHLYRQFLSGIGASTPELQELFAQEVQGLTPAEMLILKDNDFFYARCMDRRGAGDLHENAGTRCGEGEEDREGTLAVH